MRKALKQAVDEKKSFENKGNKQMRKLRFGTLVLMLMPFLLLNLSAQGADYIAGKITDSKTGDPLPGTNIFIELTNYGAATDIDGNYKINIGSGFANGQTVKLTARYIGYRSQTQQLALEPGATTQDFALIEDVLELDAIVVTGVVDETPRTNLTISVGHVSSEALERVPAISVETALRGKVAGVKIVAGSGEPGSAASVMLRAPTSINSGGRSQDPLFIVDGIIIDPSVSGSPLSDINADDIESIDVVKGAAAASLYGSRAANGVINIITNRGKGLALNQTKIRFRSEFGFNDLIKGYPLNQSHWFRIHEGGDTYVDANGVKVTPGDFIDKSGNFVDPREKGVASRTGDRYTKNYDPDNPDAGQTMAQIFFSDKPYKYISTGDITVDPSNLKPILDASTGQPLGLELLPNGTYMDNLRQFFDPGQFRLNTASISQNTDVTNFNFALSERKETGVISGLVGFERQTARIGVDHSLSNDLTVSFSGFYSRVAQDDISTGVGSPFFGMAFMGGDADLTKKHLEEGTITKVYNAQTGYPTGIPREVGGELFILPDPIAERTNPFYEPQVADRKNTRNRIMGGLTFNYRPFDFFGLEGNFSYDRSNREYSRFFRIGYQSAFDSDITLGRYQKFPEFDESLNGSLTASFRKAFLNEDLIVRSKVRGLFENTELQTTYVEGNDFIVEGIKDLLAADPKKTHINSSMQQVRSNGLSMITAMTFRDRYIFDFLIRRDESSLFGPDERQNNYYRLSGAYRLSEEPWWPMKDLIQEFKLRASQGTAGSRPNFFARYETWAVNEGSVSKSTLGNKGLKPEFVTETEVGLDMTFLGKYSLELTRANSVVVDQLLQVPQPSYVGYTSRWENAGTLETSTWELGLQGALIQQEDLYLTVAFNMDVTDQTITKLGIPAYVATSPATQGLSILRIEEGVQYGSLFGAKYVHDVNDLLDAEKAVEAAELTQFQVNDEGLVVWVGDGKSWRDGISGKLWGTQAVLSNGETYEWGMPVRYEGLDQNKLAAGDSVYTEQFIIGSVVPDFNWSFSGNLDWRKFSVYALFDAQVGGDVYSRTEQWGFGIEQRSGEADQAGKSDATKKPTRYYNQSGGTSERFIFDGSFVKLRELSVKYTFDETQLRGVLGLNKLSLGVIGRNLFSWDNYDRGTDPEVGISSGSTGSAVISKIDSFTYPNFRSFTGYLEIEF